MGRGGKYEGYLPVWQDDSAGPHVEAKFLTFLRENFEREGWVMEPQADQMPHMNVKDLAVFPSMSKRHTSLSRKRGGLSVSKEEEIWLAAKDVWDKLPNSTIARSYVLAHRIAKKVVAHNGDNTFLGDSNGLHCGVRDDFHDTLNGVRRKDGRRIPAPPVTELPEIFPFGRRAAVVTEADPPDLVNEAATPVDGGGGRGRGGAG